MCTADAHTQPNQWIAYFTSTENRHALPIFTSFINTICAYDPVGYGVPYNHLMFADAREPLVEAALQVLCVTLDNDVNAAAAAADAAAGGPPMGQQHTVDVSRLKNIYTYILWKNIEIYLSVIYLTK